MRGSDNPKVVAAPARISAAGWAMLGLLVLASVLFFIDRKALAILKGTITPEFHLTSSHYSWLINAYLLPYTVGYLFSGQLIDRWGTRRCASVFLIGMSIATVGCGLVRNFNELLAAQVLLGVSESGVVPAIMVMMTKWFPPERRGFVVTTHQALQSFGPIITPMFVAALTNAYGWRFSFLIPGTLSFALAAVWYFSDRSGVSVAPTGSIQTDRPGLGSLKFVFATPALRGVVLARIITDPAWFFLLYWQEPFLQDRAGWTLSELGKWTWMPPAAAALSNVLIGSWSDKIFRLSGHAPSARRLVLMRLALFAPCFALAPLVVGSKPFVLGLLVLCYVLSNCWLTMVNVLVTEVAPVGKVGTAFGTLSALGGGASIAFNYAAGPIVDHLGYGTMFFACACLYPIAAWVLCRSYESPAAAVEIWKSTEPGNERS